jgi:hypothetical protein
MFACSRVRAKQKRGATHDLRSVRSDVAQQLGVGPTGENDLSDHLVALLDLFLSDGRGGIGRQTDEVNVLKGGLRVGFEERVDVAVKEEREVEGCGSRGGNWRDNESRGQES